MFMVRGSEDRGEGGRQRGRRSDRVAVAPDRAAKIAAAGSDGKKWIVGHVGFSC